MPRLSPIPRLPAPAGSMSPSPIDDRYYVLNVSGRPVRCYDYTEHSIWVSCEGKGRQIKDRLLEHAVDV